ncbi:hypothetical protein F4778DRAFT_732707 [Xylariomycetidae sp. FL2044]|nr:hypothetical protein F4778DRAFT_732707 [Xylariomycetidae sp. FL2044]
MIDNPLTINNCTAPSNPSNMANQPDNHSRIKQSQGRIDLFQYGNGQPARMTGSSGIPITSPIRTPGLPLMQQPAPASPYIHPYASSIPSPHPLHNHLSRSPYPPQPTNLPPIAFQPAMNPHSHQATYGPELESTGPAYLQNMYENRPSPAAGSPRVPYGVWPNTSTARELLSPWQSPARINPPGVAVPPMAGHTTSMLVPHMPEASAEVQAAPSKKSKKNTTAKPKPQPRGRKRNESEARQSNARPKIPKTATSMLYQQQPVPGTTHLSSPLQHTYSAALSHAQLVPKATISPTQQAQRQTSAQAIAASHQPVQISTTPEISSPRHQQTPPATTNLEEKADEDKSAVELTQALRDEMTRMDTEGQVREAAERQEDRRPCEEDQFRWPGDTSAFPAEAFEEDNSLPLCAYRPKVIHVGTPVDGWWDLCSMPAHEGAERRQRRIDYYRTKLRVSVYAMRCPAAGAGAGAEGAIEFRMYEDGKDPAEILARGAPWPLRYTRLNPYFEGMGFEKVDLWVRHMLASVPGRDDCLMKWEKN